MGNPSPASRQMKKNDFIYFQKENKLEFTCVRRSRPTAGKGGIEGGAELGDGDCAEGRGGGVVGCGVGGGAGLGGGGRGDRRGKPPVARNSSAALPAHSLPRFL